MSVIIVAEAGVNHNQNMDWANQLVDIAAAAGADVFKTQTFTADSLVTLNCPPSEYQVSNSGAVDQYSMLKALELPYSWHLDLKKRCEGLGVEFLSTAFSEADFDFLRTLGLQRIKIPSGEISNLPFVVHQARSKLPIILSTGMADEQEIERALGAVAFGYLAPETENPSVSSFDTYLKMPSSLELLQSKVIILHCTSDYPVAPRDVHLRAMASMRERFWDIPIGYSDHTVGIAAAVAAVALGAVLIEKHYTIDPKVNGFKLKDDLPGPDHAASLLPVELEAMCTGIRAIEQAMKIQPNSNELEKIKLAAEVCQEMEIRYGVDCRASGLQEMLGLSEKRVGERAAKVAKIAKKSLVARHNIRKGDIFSSENLAAKRPMGGLSSEYYFDLVGQLADRDYQRDDFIVMPTSSQKSD